MKSRNQYDSVRYAVERLEERTLFTAWGVYPVMIGQDQVANSYPQLTGKGVTVAIIDSGADYKDPKLGGGMGPGTKVIAGYDFTDNDSDPMPVDNPHGTGIMGIIAANGYDYNGRHYQGIAPQVNVVLLREETSAQAKQALDWVIAHRIQYNISIVSLVDFIGSGFFPAVYNSELQNLYNSGVWISTPVGNQGASVPIENPATSPYVYATGAVDQSDQIYSETERGSAMDMLAPGVNVTIPYWDVTTQTATVTQYATGTSWANAHVVGAAILIKQIDPTFTAAQIESILQDSGVPHFDSVSGLTYPRLDLMAAVQLAYQRASTRPLGPYLGSPLAISNTVPSVLQAEDFDSGPDGTAYHDKDAFNQGGAYRAGGVDIETDTDNGVAGYDVGWTQVGEWMGYTVTVAKKGSYDVDVRASSLGVGGSFHLAMVEDGKDVRVSPEIAVPDTGAWSTWKTISAKGLQLPAGKRMLKIVFDKVGASGFVGNFDYLTFKPMVATPATKGQTPFLGTPIKITTTGPVKIEAEDFDNGGEGVAYHDTNVANQGGDYRNTGVDITSADDNGSAFVVGYTKAGEWLEYSVNVAKTAYYSADFRIASVGTGGTFHLNSDVNGTFSNVTGKMTVSQTGNTSTWRDVTKKIHLTAGNHVLRLSMDTAGSTGIVGYFDYFTIAPYSSTGPVTNTPFSGAPITISKSGSTTIEAEDFDNGGEGVAYHDTTVDNLGGQDRATGVDIENTPDTGGGFDVGWVVAGEWMKYTVAVSTAAKYTLGVRVSSAGQGGTFHLEVDGVKVSSELTVPDTGSYATFQTLTTQVSLPAGHHVLRLVMDTNGPGGYVGNFNWFSLA